ncbi:hypothetical protein B0H34DRAFT_688679 [Crassisporium funariophilum]|nr:hypothetical protein B0H34DRAFT_688679 [Crassisporium funariophilum]
MSSPGSPSSAEPYNPNVSNHALAAAAARRILQTTPQLTAAQMAVEHEKRQKFRRLVDPGITRPNPKDQALTSLKTLLAISDNLIREPENPKFQQFKPTNTVIKRDLVNPKGALEYAIELGFRPEVQDFQPYYRFHRRHTDDLQIGNTVLREYLVLELEKQERAALAKKNEKATIKAAEEKVKLAFMDDRRTRMQRDEMEKEQRAARALLASRQAAQQLPTPRSTTPEGSMPGSGHVLGLLTLELDEPPSYEHSPDRTE